MTSEEPTTDLRSVTHLYVFQSSPDRPPRGYVVPPGQAGPRKLAVELPTGLAPVAPNIESPLALLQAWQNRTVAVLPQPLGNKCLLHPKED